jgi:hypothetical protein
MSLTVFAGACAVALPLLFLAMTVAFAAAMLLGAIQKVAFTRQATWQPDYVPVEGDVIYREFWDRRMRPLGLHCGLLGEVDHVSGERVVYHVYRDAFGSRGTFVRDKLSDFMESGEEGDSAPDHFYVMHLPRHTRRPRARAVDLAKTLVGSCLPCHALSLSANCETYVLGLAQKRKHAVVSHQVLQLALLARRLAVSVIPTLVHATVGNPRRAFGLDAATFGKSSSSRAYTLTKHPYPLHHNALMKIPGIFFEISRKERTWK